MKKFQLSLTKAWQEQSPILKLLAPLSWVYRSISALRKKLYQAGIFYSYQSDIPVLVVGNITVGGSGKTPLIIALVEYLQSRGVAVAVISRGYGGNQAAMPCVVTQDSTPEQVGDEPCLIVQNTGVLMTVGANRKAAIELLLQKQPNLQLILSDDGLQHYALQRDFEWIVVDVMRGFGNQKLLPQGFLREPIDRLQSSTVIYHDRMDADYAADVLTMFLQVDNPTPLMDSASRVIDTTKAVYAITGIGHPKRFFQTVRDLGYQPICQAFPDHHKFCLDDLLPFAQGEIFVTAKDAVKLRQLAKTSSHKIFDNIWVVPVRARLSDAVYQLLDCLIDDLPNLKR